VPVNTKKAFTVSMLDFLGKEPWGLEKGRDVMERLEKMLRDREPIVNLNLRGVERIDSSCSREALVNLVRRQRGERWFFLTGIANESVRENLEAAFERQKMSIIFRIGDEYEVVGSQVSEPLTQALRVVEKLGTATAKQVCGAIKGLMLPACNNRLRDLCDAGLLLRSEGTAPSGGKEFMYTAVK
jgi:hypothetical protein